MFFRAKIVAEFISNFGKAFEVGIGYYWDVAEILNKMGVLLGVCDIRNLEKEAERRGVRFFKCDVERPDSNLVNFCKYADVIYSIRPPIELWKHIIRFAKMCDCVCVIKPMYGDYLDEKVEKRLINYKGEVFYTWKFKHQKSSEF